VRNLSHGRGDERMAPPVATPQAWRDGDELVIRVGAPLPPICVFCGAMAVTAIRNAIETRGHPFDNLQVLSTAVAPGTLPDARVRRRVVARASHKRLGAGNIARR
jgi:hypothetical protein